MPWSAPAASDCGLPVQARHGDPTAHNHAPFAAPPLPRVQSFEAASYTNTTVHLKHLEGWGLDATHVLLVLDGSLEGLDDEWVPRDEGGNGANLSNVEVRD